MSGYFRSIIDTLWLYPRSNIEAVLATTTIPYIRQGSVLEFQSIADIEAIASDIYTSTISLTLPNGFNVGVGSLLTDDNRRFTFCLENGATFMIWGEATLLTLQASLPSGGLAPIGTQGYLTTWLATGNDIGKGYDPVRVVRTG
jgi:hypothetical protein